MPVRRLLSILLLGCASSGEPAEAERAPSTASDWSWDGADGDAGADLAVLEADLAAQAAVLVAWRPDPLFASYAQARTLGDGTCPPEDSLAVEGVTNTWWYGACYTGAGTHFNGVMTAWDWSEVDISTLGVVDLSDLARPGYAYVGHGFEGRIDIYDTSGTQDFSCSCEGVSARAVAPDGSELLLQYTRGPASWTGPEAADSWMQDPVTQAKVALVAESTGPGGDWELRVSATQSGVGERYSSSTLDLSVQLLGAERSCGAVTGTLNVRDAAVGTWDTLIITAGEACQGCVTLDEGTACLDARPWVQEAEARWW